MPTTITFAGMANAHVCPSCGSPIEDRYCGHCGEKLLAPEDHELKHYFSALVNAFTFADSKFLRTLKAVVLRPGQLSAAYMAGRRVPYMRPVAFFFLANFIYFAIPGFQTFNVPLSTHLHAVPYKGWAVERVEQKLAKSGTGLEELRLKFDTASSANAKLLLVVMVFFLALPIGLVHLGKFRYISTAITAGFELMSFYLWAATIALSLIIFLLVLLFARLGLDMGFLDGDDFLIWPIMGLHLWANIWISRRLFRCSWPGAVWRSLFMLAGLAFAITLYRSVLFVVTLWQVS